MQRLTNFRNQVGAGFSRKDVIAVRGSAPLSLSWSQDGQALTIIVPASVPGEAVFVKATEAQGIKVLVQRPAR